MNWKTFTGLAAGLVLLVFAGLYIYVAAYDANKLKPELSSALRESTGLELTLAGDLKLKLGLTITVEAGRVSLANASWGSRPNLAQTEHLEIDLALLPLLSGEVVIKRLLLIKPDILIETNQKGLTNIGAITSQADSQPAENPTGGGQKDPQAPARPAGGGDDSGAAAMALDEVRIEKGLLTYRDGVSGGFQRISLEELSIKPSSLAGDRRISLNGSYNKLPLKLESKVRFKRFASGFSLKAADLSAQLAGSDLSGSLGLSTKAGRTTVDAKLSSKLFNLRDIRQKAADSAPDAKAGSSPAAQAAAGKSKPLSKPKETGNTAKAGGKVFSSKPLDLNFLRTTDLKVLLEAKHLQLGDLLMDDLRLEAVQKKGRLALENLKAKIGEGSLQARGSLAARDKTAAMDLDLTMSQAGLGQLLGGRDPELKHTKGTVNLLLDLKGEGASEAAIMAGLSGKTVVHVSRAKLANDRLGLLGVELITSLLQVINPLAKREKDTTLNCLVARFDVNQGVAKSKVLLFDTDRTLITGHGLVNFKTEELKLVWNPKTKEGVGIKGLASLGVSLNDLTTPFMLSGTLAKPALTINPSRTLLTIGKALGGIALLGPAGAAISLPSLDLAGKEPCPTALKHAYEGIDKDARWAN